MMCALMRTAFTFCRKICVRRVSHLLKVAELGFFYFLIDPTAAFFCAGIDNAGEFSGPNGIHKSVAAFYLVTDIEGVPVRAVNFGKVKISRRQLLDLVTQTDNFFVGHRGPGPVSGWKTSIFYLNKANRFMASATGRKNRPCCRDSQIFGPGLNQFAQGIGGEG